MRTIRRDQKWMRRYYKDRYEKNPALIDYLYYMDSMAKIIGCEVPFARALVRDPLLWCKLMFSSLNGADYRLVGPGSNWKQAADIIKKTPQFNNWYDAIFRWSVLSAATLLSMLLGVVDGRFQLIKSQASL